MKMSTLYAALSGALLLGTAALVPAQSTTPSGSSSATSTQTTGTATSGNTMNTAGAGSTAAHPVKNAKVAASGEYRADKDRIEADYKAAKEKCKSMPSRSETLILAR